MTAYNQLQECVANLAIVIQIGVGRSQTRSPTSQSLKRSVQRIIQRVIFLIQKLPTALYGRKRIGIQQAPFGYDGSSVGNRYFSLLFWLADSLLLWCADGEANHHISRGFHIFRKFFINFLAGQL